MPAVKGSVKWNKEKYDVEVNLDEPPLVFKAQLFALTGVSVERQKVMVKGRIIGDENWSGFSGLADGVQFMLLGSADALPQAPKQKVVFTEDMSEHELQRQLNIPAGLKNLGNTCYMNATLQCLKTVPEFREALKSYQPSVALGHVQSPADLISGTVRSLYESMDKTAEVTPFLMLQVLHMVFPQFATKGEHGSFQQQDANECWVELIRMFQQRLPGLASSTSASGAIKPFITQYFGGQFDVTLKCSDPDALVEPPVKSVEDFLQLSCYVSTEVKYLQSGLKAKLTEELIKNSPTLNRDAKYDRTAVISRLPAYLSVQMVRFYYKENARVNAKILKDVKFTLSLDVFELCSTTLQERLIPMRNRFKEQEDRNLELAEKKKKGEEVMELSKVNVPYSFADDTGSNNSGFYELQAVLTHKGRSSDSGHYVAWVKQGPNKWFMCDDDVMSAVTDEDILKLSGGGDWHCAYVLLYGPRILEETQGAGDSKPEEIEIGTPV